MYSKIVKAKGIITFPNNVFVRFEFKFTLNWDVFSDFNKISFRNYEISIVYKIQIPAITIMRKIRNTVSFYCSVNAWM